jgi:O-antigen ligase
LPLCFRLADYYEHSILAFLLRSISALFRHYWAQSKIGGFFHRESTLSRAWRRSLFSEILGILLNLPGLLLRKLYLALQTMFEGSIVARIGFALVEDTPIAIGWLMLVILIIPYESWNNAYSLIGFVLMLMFAIATGMRHKTRRLDVASVGPYTVFFAGFILLAWPLSAYVHLSERFLLYHIPCMLCVLVIVSTVEKAQQLRRLAVMATTGLIIVSAYGIVQRIQGVEVNKAYVDLTLNKDLPGRVFSMFENPNAFGEVLVLLIPIAVGLLFGGKGWGSRFLGLLGACLGAVSLAMTYSRAGWIGLAVAAVLFIFLWNKKLLPALVVVAVAAVPFLPDTVLHRMTTIFNMSDTSTSSRFPLYEAAMRLLWHRPLQGVGLGSDAVRSAVSDLNFYHGKAPFVHCHDIYLQVWAETGIFGLLSLLGAVGWTLKRGGKTVLRKLGSSSVRMLIAGSVSALLGIMVCGVADYIWHYPRVMLIFWFVFAMAVAGIRLAMREEKQTQEARRQES